MKIHIIPNIEEIEKYRELKLNFEYNDFFYPFILDDYPELERRIKIYEKNNMRGNTLHGVFFDICLDSVDRRVQLLSEERVDKSLEIASRLKCKGVVFHTNYIEWIKDIRYRERWVTENARIYTNMLKKYPDLEIYIENMFDDSPAMLKALIELVNNERLGACLDVAHANISSTPIPVWFHELGPYIKHLHINDNDGIHDSHEALGNGNIDYDYVFSRIKELKGDPSVLIEVNGIDKIEASINYLREHGLWK